MDTDENTAPASLDDKVRGLTIIWTMLTGGSVLFFLVLAGLVLESGPVMDQPWSDIGLLLGMLGTVFVVGLLIIPQVLLPRMLSAQPNPTGKPLDRFTGAWITSMAMMNGSATIAAVFYMLCANPLLIAGFVVSVVKMVACKPSVEKYQDWLRNADNSVEKSNE